jgi:hypothetical protein
VIIVNLGETKADSLADVRLNGSAATILEALLND